MMSGSLGSLFMRTRVVKSFMVTPIINSAASTTSLITRSLNCNRASITRIHRLQYLRSYPTLLVNQDGSTVTIRYHEPRKIIKLPFDISNLSEDEKKVHLERRKPKTRVKLEDDTEEVKFDAQKYLRIVKKK